MTRIDIIQDIGDFFVKEIENSVQRHRLSFSPLLKKYLSELLVKFSNINNYSILKVDQESSTESLAEAWLKSLNLSTKEQFHKLQHLGDYTLFTSGFFADKIHGSIVDMDYYHAIGTKSYEKAGELSSSLVSESNLNVFFELAAQFKKIADLLEELSLKSNLFDHQDTLKLYTKWQQTKSDKFARILFSKGIAPNSSEDEN